MLPARVRLPDGLKENQKLPEPILTPTTKADAGHDENISREEIIARGIVPAEIYEQVEKYALAYIAFADLFAILGSHLRHPLSRFTHETV